MVGARDWGEKKWGVTVSHVQFQFGFELRLCNNVNILMPLSYTFEVVKTVNIMLCVLSHNHFSKGG